jgi:diguanylate cyclase (GGDEF)-like protein/PAS domain S-box-containing protein
MSGAPGLLTPELKRRWFVVTAAGLVVCALIVGQLLGRLPAHPAPQLAALVLAAILASGLTGRRFVPHRAAFMPPAFVLTFLALLLQGPHASALVATAGALAPPLRSAGRSRRRMERLRAAIAALLAAEAGGAMFVFASAALGEPVWPWQGLPIAGAVVAYHLTHGLLGHAVLPLLSRKAVDRAWVTHTLEGGPTYLVGASIATGLAAIIDHQFWQGLPVAAVTLLLAWRIYADYLTRVDEDNLRLQLVDSFDQDVVVIDAEGLVIMWSDAIERMTGHPRRVALGRPLLSVLPDLVKTELPHAIRHVAAGQPRTIVRLTFANAGAARACQAKVAALPDGIAIIWQDITEQRRAEQETRKAEACLALAAEAANDGLWQWDLRSGEFFVSGRWRAMLGLPAQAGIVTPEVWLERVHPEDAPGLRAALEAHLAGTSDPFVHEHRIRHETGDYRRYLCRGTTPKDAGRRRDRIAGSLTDTTEHALAQERLRSVGALDALTGLLNRTIFAEGLGRRIEDFHQRRASNWFAVLYLDLDRFKIVNDSLGHLVGDELLIGVARRLEKCLRQHDTLARLGGDEFAILLNGLAGVEQANAIALRIQQSLCEPFSIGGREVFTSASIGIAFGPAQYTNPDDMMRDADTAMYHAKANGKARHEMFDDDMHARVRDRVSLETDLRRAVAASDFTVVYQPIVLLTTGMCVGFESLVRWNRNGEAVSPATFIPIAEELGLIAPLGNWVMEQACLAFGEWRRRYPHAGLDYITVNVSSRQLLQHRFVRLVEQAVARAGMKPSDLRIEITETALLDNPGEAAAVLRELQQYGAKVYLDDFGTGYSSLSHLHTLPVDALKIDRSFVKSLSLRDRPSIVESILALARTLQTGVVAEGIETHVQAAELQRLGCTHAQGFLFSKPLPADKAGALIQAHESLTPPSAPAGVNGWDGFDPLPGPGPSGAPARASAALVVEPR